MAASEVAYLGHTLTAARDPTGRGQEPGPDADAAAQQPEGPQDLLGGGQLLQGVHPRVRADGLATLSPDQEDGGVVEGALAGGRGERVQDHPEAHGQGAAARL